MPGRRHLPPRYSFVQGPDRDRLGSSTTSPSPSHLARGGGAAPPAGIEAARRRRSEPAVG